MNWAGRISDHCQYLAGQQRMDAAELYDLWLRYLQLVPAVPVCALCRAGHRHPKEWMEFLCEGEGVFGDCLEDVPLHHWPGSEGPQASSGPVQFTEEF